MIDSRANAAPAPIIDENAAVIICAAFLLDLPKREHSLDLSVR